MGYDPAWIGHEYQRFGARSYAQHGDDIIMSAILDRMGVTKPSYIDFGAHHPFHISNTALFYSRGSRGINVEPDPDLIGRFAVHRPEDVNLCCGISTQLGEETFYVTANRGLSSFDRSAAELQGIVAEIQVPVFTFAQFMAEHAPAGVPDVLLLDIEGRETAVLESIDFDAYRPKVVCVEAWTCGVDNSGGIRLALDRGGYFLHSWADANMIFADEAYRERLR